VSPTQHCTRKAFVQRKRRNQNLSPAPSEVLSPSAFCQPWGATYPGESHLIQLSCVLRVSHPLDALLPPRPARLIPSWFRSWGSPFEALLLSLVPYALSSAAAFLEFILLQGFCTPMRVPHVGMGFSQHQRQLPPWAFPSLRFLVRGCWSQTILRTTLPSHAFCEPSRTIAHPASQGFYHHERSPSLSTRA